MNILVFDIGGTAIKYGVCAGGRLLHSAETPTRAHLGGRRILETLNSLIAQETGYEAIGVSTAGQVNAAEGSILYANSNIPDYTGCQIRRELEARFHVPVAVENDVNAAALGEAVYGSGRDIPSFLCLTYGTGIGGAIIENHRIYHGSGYSAAEFGSIITHCDAKLAGSDFWDGCYERYASATALVNAARRYDTRLTDGRKIFQALDDPRVMEILDRWTDELMAGLASLIHIFNPTCVILGGGIMSQPLVFQKIDERRGRFIMPSFNHVKIRPALLGNQAGLLGAYSLAETALRQGGVS